MKLEVKKKVWFVKSLNADTVCGCDWVSAWVKPTRSVSTHGGLKRSRVLTRVCCVKSGPARRNDSTGSLHD